MLPKPETIASVMLKNIASQKSKLRVKPVNSNEFYMVFNKVIISKPPKGH